MEKPVAFENYPLWIVLVINATNVLTYAIGAYLLSLVGTVWAALYIAYIVFLELRVYKGSCTNCYYFGKRCAFGKGKVASILFKKGKPEKFCEREFSFAALVPQFMVLLAPLSAGAILLLREFQAGILALVLIPPVIWFLGNPIIYGKLACAHCKQERICCPASEFFEKKVTSS